jgi:hypothetical protein
MRHHDARGEGASPTVVSNPVAVRRASRTQGMSAAGTRAETRAKKANAVRRVWLSWWARAHPMNFALILCFAFFAGAEALDPRRKVKNAEDHRVGPGPP